MSLLIDATGWGATAVLVLLFGLSIWSFAIMIRKWRAVRSAASPDFFDEAERRIVSGESLNAWLDTQNSVPASGLKAALAALPGGEPAVERGVRHALSEPRRKLEKDLPVLATLGSNAPFIGLFGTVLGIIQAFGVLANNPNSTGMVMSSLAEALIATAVGLFVAIPAVVAFNYFSHTIRDLLGRSERLADLLVARRLTRGS